MKKIFLGLMLIIFIISINILPAYAAVDPGKIVTDVAVFSGKLYLSDWRDGGVILRDVQPLDESDAETAKELEYTLIETYSGNIKNGSTGDELDLSSLAWYLDMDVNVTVARLESGTLRILSVTTK